MFFQLASLQFVLNRQDLLISFSLIQHLNDSPNDKCCFDFEFAWPWHSMSNFLMQQKLYNRYRLQVFKSCCSTPKLHVLYYYCLLCLIFSQCCQHISLKKQNVEEKHSRLVLITEPTQIAWLSDKIFVIQYLNHSGPLKLIIESCKIVK